MVIVLNFFVIFFIIIYGLFFVKSKNWINEFVFYGIWGVFEGVVSVFYVFVGFDVVIMVVEEVINL